MTKMQAIDANELSLSEPVLKGIAAGEGIVVERDHVAIAVILPVFPSNGPRPFGLGKGEFVVPDDFNDPLPDWDEWLEGSR